MSESILDALTIAEEACEKIALKWQLADGPRASGAKAGAFECVDAIRALKSASRAAQQEGAQPRLIPDSECVQGKCACTTTGCWGKCARANLGYVIATAAAPSPALPEGWLPIETAPKDGTEIILRRDDRVTSGSWEEEYAETGSEYHGTTGEYLGEFETGIVREAYWASWDGGFTEDAPPTHWMPLPAAPDQTAREEG